MALAPARRLAQFAALAASTIGATAGAATDCTMSTAGVAFGSYDPLLATNTDATGELVLTCVHASGGAERVNYTIALSAGRSGSYAQRELRSGTSALKYNLYDSVARTRIWGSGLGGTSVVGGSFTVGPGQGNGRRQAIHPIYGRVPPLQGVVPGSYNDTILVTLAF